ncbi:MAG: hypothetical protein J6K53_10405 [Roseburia sp.]|nr:hypothetical protein [Roseburia sp.]
MENLQDKEGRIVSLFAQAEEIIRQTFADEQGMRRYLDYKSRIPGYSANNTAMLLAQRPQAKYMGSFQFWKGERTYIHAGEKGTAVLMPAVQNGRRTSYKLGWLFDLDQTNLSEEKKQKLLQSRKNTLPEGVNTAQISELIKNVIKVDETPPEDWLQKEIAQYLLYLQYGLPVAGIRFEGLAQEEIQSMTITDKRKVLGEAFRLTEYYKEEIKQKLDEMQKNPLPEEKEVPGYTEQAEAIAADDMSVLPDEQESETAMNETHLLPLQAEKGKIEDFGRKIGGARKDIWRERGLQIEDLAGMNAAETIKYVTKDNIWKKPDYLQMIQDGTPIRVAYFIKEVRNALPAKVAYSNLYTTPEQIRKRQEDYISLIRDVRERLLKIRDDSGIRSFFDSFVNDEVYVKRTTSYMVSRTEKGIDVTNKLLKAMQITDMLTLDRKIQREQFGVDAAHKLPRGYKIRYLKEQQEYVVIKNYHVLRDGLKSEAEAIEAAKELQKTSVASRKQRFIPKQLVHIRRDGPSNGITQDSPVTGDMYMQSFGFSGGEFGNWLNEQERQMSLNMGYDAFMDLAAALSIAPEEIALDNRLAIAFGSRGIGGKAAAVAHYEPMLEVINLTKMRGAGSLAHEWGHAFDDIMGKRLGMGGFMTKNIRDKRVPESVRQLVEAMKKRPATGEERQKRNDRLVGRAKENVEQLCRRMLPEERMNESERESWSRLLQEIAAKAEERGNSGETEEMNGAHIKWIDEKVGELAVFQKSVIGHTPNKVARDQIYYAIAQLESAFIACQREMTVQTEFYSNSVKFDSMYSKESKGYWHSDEEMFARAFACYVHDRLPWRSDYLCGHSESAVAFDTSKEEPVIIKAIPEGKERERINQCFDRVFDEFRELGLLKGVESIEHQQRKSMEQMAELQVAAGMEMPLRRKGRGR